MAETWYDWLQGSPSQRLSDLEAQRRRLGEKTVTPSYRALQALDQPVNTSATSYDPRELRMAVVQDELYPTRTSDAGNAIGTAADYAFDFGGRMRDTAFTAAAEAGRGNYGNAAGLAGRSVMAGFVPPLGAGMRGQPDDWRQAARTNGVPEATVLAYDVATDPENWITSPIRAPLNFIVPGVGVRMAGAAGRTADDVLRAIGRAPVSLVDEAGNNIRRLRGGYAQ